MVSIYEIVPGQSVGIFQLGDSLWHILDILRTRKVEYPKVDISWDPEDPIKSAVVIHLANITLYFPSSPHQSLTLISIPSIPPNFNLSYEEATLASSSQPLTRGRVGRVLGPTYGSTGQSKLVYPGISFELVGNGDREDKVTSLSVRAREGKADKVLTPLKSVIVQLGKGVILHTPEPVDIILGQTTAQDLLLDLGSPLRKFYKEDNRLERMWGTAAQDSEKDSCFWNYFQYGLDFLVSPSGVVSKVIMHTNIPGTPLFQRYARCPWTISTPSGELDYTSPLAQFRSGLTGRSETSEQYIEAAKLTVPPLNPKDVKKKKKGGSSSATPISSATKSTEDLNNGAAKLTLRSDGVEEDAMILDRVGEGGLDDLRGVGTSRLVGFDGLVVEEDQDSGGICSVLVWQSR